MIDSAFLIEDADLHDARSGSQRLDRVVQSIAIVVHHVVVNAAADE